MHCWGSDTSVIAHIAGDVNIVVIRNTGKICLFIFFSPCWHVVYHDCVGVYFNCVLKKINLFVVCFFCFTKFVKNRII